MFSITEKYLSQRKRLVTPAVHHSECNACLLCALLDIKFKVFLKKISVYLSQEMLIELSETGKLWVILRSA